MCRNVFSFMIIENADPKNRKTPEQTRNRINAFALPGLIILFSMLVSLIIAEAAYRIAAGFPVFDASNWRSEGVRMRRVGDRAIYDPIMGWTLKARYRSDGFNTIDYGIRRNFDETELRTGEILAVGDSFTEGFDEVIDSGSWPAHLEKILNRPTINGGVAGYGTDQIILRAEQLLPIVNPRIIIVGMSEFDIERSAQSEAGAPKPYFSVENDELVFHAPGPLDPKTPESRFRSALRDALSYSALADHLLSRLTPRFWYPRQASVYEAVDNDPVEVTCKLLKRLKNQTDLKNIRLLLFLQHDGERVLEEDKILPEMRNVTSCAQETGIQVVDQFASLKSVTDGDPDIVGQYYVIEDNEYGHMSSKGNEHAAQLLAAALRSTHDKINANVKNEQLLPN
jgi:lysophospholipase L1-like esterase